MSSAFILDAIRSPFGRYGGGLAAVRPDDLAAHAVRALLERTPALEHERIDRASSIPFSLTRTRVR